MNERHLWFIQVLEELHRDDARHFVETTASPPKSFSEDERIPLYRQCHGIARQFDLDRDRRDYMKRHWGKKSMRDLADDKRPGVNAPDLSLALLYLASPGTA